MIVTTPQDIALLDAQKGIEMFRKVDVPVLGVIENMAVHICSECGHREHIFGEQGGERIAGITGCPCWPACRWPCRSGSRPMPVAHGDRRAGFRGDRIYLEAAAAVQDALAGQARMRVRQFPEIKISDD